MREYSVVGAGLTLANQAVTAAFINPASGTVIEMIRAWLSQSGSATSAQQRVQLNNQAAVQPTLVSATPIKSKTGDPASGVTGGTAGAAGTSGVNASAEGAGTKSNIYPDAFNVLNGWLWVPTPLETQMVRAADSLGWAVHVPVAPSSLSNWNMGLTFRELG